MRIFWLMVLFALPAWALPPFQTLIDATPSGGTLRPAAGRYAGPAVIDRSMVVDGGGKVSVEGGGTVLTVRTNNAQIRGLRLVGTGDSHDQIHSGLQVEGDDNRVEGNIIEDALFGIHVKQGNRNRILDNAVTGKDRPVGERGDGLRLWNSKQNLVEGNRFRRIRDLTFANSPENVIARNDMEDGRYGMQFVFSPRSRVVGNKLVRTGTGIVVLYSPELTVQNNHVAHALDGGGGGLAFKESGNALVEGNDIVHCSVGLSADSPLTDDSVLTVRGNRFAHNITGVYFYGERGGHRIVANRFESNLTQVSVSAPGVGEANIWRDNYWSDYQGFDRNGDGIGDTPHEIWLYADRIWQETPKATFFRNSPALETLDFLERLAPFASPALILRDERPRMRR